MVDWIYCGTNPPVDAGGTQSLLRTHDAIWCSPPGLRPWPGVPQPRERLWLVWRDGIDGPISLLGAGRLALNTQQRFGTNLLHTNTDIPGVRDEAEQLGYGGGLGMSFLRLQNVVFPTDGHPAIAQLGLLSSALNEATPTQSGILSAMLPV